MTMTKDMKRLMRYAVDYANDFHWMFNGVDAIESLESLEELELIERNEAGDRWRITDNGLNKGAYDEDK